MKFFITTAAMLVLSGPLSAQQASTKTITIMPTQPSAAAKAPAVSTAPVKTVINKKSSAAVKKAAVKPAENKKEAAKPVAVSTAAKMSGGPIGEPVALPAEKKSVAVQPLQPEAGFIVGKKHVVVKGDTLWDLSKKYYGDPFKWGGIYNANTGTVKDPDHIYPANELMIPDITEEIKPAPAPAVVAEPETDVVTYAPRAEEAEAAPAVQGVMPAVPSVPAVKAPAPVVKKGKKAKNALAEELPDLDPTDLSEDMPQDLKEWPTDVKIVPESWTGGGVVTGTESGGSEYSLAFSGEVVLIKASASSAFKPGDVLTSYFRGVPAFYKKSKVAGRELQKTGMLEVISVEGNMVKARILEATTSINKGQVVKK